LPTGPRAAEVSSRPFLDSYRRIRLADAVADPFRADDVPKPAARVPTPPGKADAHSRPRPCASAPVLRTPPSACKRRDSRFRWISRRVGQLAACASRRCRTAAPWSTLTPIVGRAVRAALVRTLAGMRLEGIRAGDIVEVDRRGRRFHALVSEHGPGGLGIEPLDRRITYRSCRAHEVTAHRVKRGRSRADSERAEPSVLLLELDTRAGNDRRELIAACTFPPPRRTVVRRLRCDARVTDRRFALERRPQLRGRGAERRARLAKRGEPICATAAPAEAPNPINIMNTPKALCVTIPLRSILCQEC
jgi:hypothetical protein